jgi:signal peptidase I
VTETTDSSPEGQPNSDPAEPEVVTSQPAVTESDATDASDTTEAEDERTGKKRAARETVLLAAIALVLYYVMLTFVALPYLIPSESM